MSSIYCEVAYMNGFFEPFNAISNLSFIIAAFFLFLFFRKNDIKDFKSFWFLLIALLIGAGSFTWHFYRHPITNLFDSIPITLFIASFGYFYALKVFKSNNKAFLFVITSLIIVFIGQIYLESIIPIFLGNNGYLYFLMSFLFLVPIFWSKSISKRYFKKGLFLYALFILALTFRQIDIPICSTIPIGSHFIWHILNGIVLYYAVTLLYKN